MCQYLMILYKYNVQFLQSKIDGNLLYTCSFLWTLSLSYIIPEDYENLHWTWGFYVIHIYCFQSIQEDYNGL
jgi:hypothetical protein